MELSCPSFKAFGTTAQNSVPGLKPGWEGKEGREEAKDPSPLFSCTSYFRYIPALFFKVSALFCEVLRSSTKSNF